jgi:ribonuclease-3
VYLDGSLGAARELLERELAAALEDPEAAFSDAKTRLQEWLQARGEPPPSYATTGESGPAHAPEFRVEVRAGDRVLGRGAGRSKRAAEQSAARHALAGLEATVSVRDATHG